MKRLFAAVLAVLMLAACAPNPRQITVTLLYPDGDFLELQEETRTVTVT